MHSITGLFLENRKLINWCINMTMGPKYSTVSKTQFLCPNCMIQIILLYSFLKTYTTSAKCLTMCVTPHVQEMLKWPGSSHGTDLHTRSTSLTLLSQLRVKGLNRRCYVWNNKDYMLALSLLNLKSGTKHTNHRLHLCHMSHLAQLYNYYKLLTGWGVTMQDSLNA